MEEKLECCLHFEDELRQVQGYVGQQRSRGMLDKGYQENRKEPFISWSNWEIYTLPSVKYVVAAYVVSPRSNATVIPLSIQARGTDVSNLHLFSKVIFDPPRHDALWFVARDVFGSGDGMKHTARTSPGLSELYKSQTMSRTKTCIPSRVGSPYRVHWSEALRHGSNHENMLTN